VWYLMWACVAKCEECEGAKCDLCVCVYKSRSFACLCVHHTIEGRHHSAPVDGDRGGEKDGVHGVDGMAVALIDYGFYVVKMPCV